MKIERLTLLRLVETSLAQVEQGVRARLVSRYERGVEERHRYHADTRDAWFTFAHTILDRMTVADDDDTVITVSDVPPALRGYGSVRLFDTRTDAPLFTEEQMEGVLARDPGVRELRTLRDVLNATQDELVSTYALEKMGFTMKALLRKNASSS